MTAPIPVWLGWLGLLALAGGVARFPVASAIGSVFFLAGPHNWLEARYLLGRLPARTGKLWPYFLCSSLGWLLLMVFFLAGYVVQTGAHWLTAWNAALVAWVCLLARLRSREHPRRDWPWLLPAAFLLLSLDSLSSMWFSIGLVYLHPLLAMLLADRELQVQRHPWRGRWRQVMAIVPVGLLMVVVACYWAPPPPDRSGLGSFFQLPGNTLAWLAAHTYLEMVHYAIWIGLLPAVAVSLGKSRLEVVPLLRKARWRLKAARLGLGLAALAVAALWWCFIQDYALTREVYFDIAIGHVLIEFPFLLRTL